MQPSRWRVIVSHAEARVSRAAYEWLDWLSRSYAVHSSLSLGCFSRWT